MMAANPAREPACSTTCGMWIASGKPPPAAWRAVMNGSNLSRACGRSDLRRRRALLGGQNSLAAGLGDGGREARRIAAVDDVLDARERLVDPVRVERRALGRDDLVRARRLGPLVGVVEVLVDLLARARTDDLDRDVHVRFVP